MTASETAAATPAKRAPKAKASPATVPEAKTKIPRTKAAAPAAAPAAKAPKAAKAAPAPEPTKVKRVEKNGILLPKEGTIAFAIWERFNAFATANSRPLLVNEAHDLADKDFEPGTVGAQYTNWCLFYDVTAEKRAEIRASLRAAAPAATPAKVAKAPAKAAKTKAPAAEAPAPVKRARKAPAAA